MSTLKNALPLAVLLALAACDKAPAVAVAVPAPVKASVIAGDSYELVQVERQQPPGQQLAMMRDTAYEMCKVSAELMKKPVKPFPAVPAGYGETRTTTISNGTSIVTRTETTDGDDSDMTVENGCEYRIGTNKLVAVKIIHANQMIMLDNGEGGALKQGDVSDLPDTPSFAKAQKTTEEYTDARTLNGIALRCVPKDYWLKHLTRGLDMREMCVHAKDGVAFNEMREPMILMSIIRVDLVNPKYAYNAVVEPVSLRKRDSGAPDPYLPATWLK
jgi:hypothetical protein